MGGPSITYSASGKMVAVFCWVWFGTPKILIFDVASGTYMHSHSLNLNLRLLGDI